MRSRERQSSVGASIARECAYTAVFVSLTIAVQFVLSFVPGVELVTVLFAAYSAVMGVRRALTAATAFSLLRQVIFGVEPKVLTLYLIYFNLLALTFALVCKEKYTPKKRLIFAVIVASLCTVLFTLFDDILTPLWYGYSKRVAEIYFYASLPFMGIQVVCSAVSTLCLFLPLYNIFLPLRKKLERVEKTENKLENNLESVDK